MKLVKNNVNGKSQGFEPLLYQLLETELGGVQVYTLAIELAQNADLKKEWQKYLSETKRTSRTLQG